MSNPENKKLSLPEPVLQQIVQEHLQDNNAFLTGFDAKPMQNDGWGGNDFFKAKIEWQSEDQESSNNWVIKQWHRGSPTASAMGISLPLEALAWNHGLIKDDVVPEGISVPYVGVATNEDKSKAWIVMEDISEELNTFRFPATPEKNLLGARYVLDRLACFHVYWEHPARIKIIEQQTWLAKQEAQLSMFADYYAQFLGRMPRDVESFPDEIYNRFRNATLAFIDWLPKSDL